MSRQMPHQSSAHSLQEMARVGAGPTSQHMPHQSDLEEKKIFLLLYRAAVPI